MAEKINTSREGGIDAPTRHNLDWKNPEFYDQSKIDEELYRTFEICHGCRRCVSLCDAYPTLFDLIDESETYDIDSVEKKDYKKVVDECYMCDLCYQTKCPYVPPHPWALDFPHLMLRSKAANFKKNNGPIKKKIRDKSLSSTDNFKYGSIPLIDLTINTITSSKIARKAIEKVGGIHSNATLPKFDSNTLKKRYKKLDEFNPEETQTDRTTGKVMIFGTCYCHYNTPDIGEDLINVLRFNDIKTELIEKEKCCGMPKLELGDLDSVEEAKKYNIPKLVKAIKDGYDIIAPIPSCVLMYKQELPCLLYTSPSPRDRG